MAYIGQSLTEGTRRVYTYVSTASQTTFNAVYGVGAVDVYQNGILLAPSDYTASDGTTVVLGVGAAFQDEITIVCHNTFSVADTVSASQGGTFSSDVTVEGNLTSDSGNGNFVSLTTDGAIEIRKSNGQGYIDFKDGNEDLDCRIAQYSNGLQFTTGGSGAPVNAMTMDSSGRIGIGNTSPTETLAVRTYGNSEISTQYGTGLTAKLGAYASATSVTLPSPSVHFDLAGEAGAIDTMSMRSYYNGAWKWGLKMDPDGHIYQPNKAVCVVSSQAGWATLQANTNYGITNGSFHHNQGGFYVGGGIGGAWQVVHVPVSGWYRITLQGYLAANQGNRRLSLFANQSTEVCFIQTNSSANDFTQVTSGLVYLNANDYLHYYVNQYGAIYSYHQIHHTYVTIEHMG